ncbi:MAG: energy transducer TonB [Bacteroidota bacterium]|nr:energy transducer TonB [Bacteroidota bacterium]
MLIGFMLAASLVAVFACEQKKSVKTEIAPNEKLVTIYVAGHPVEFSGDSAGVEKLKGLISESSDYELKTDSVTGKHTLVDKTNKVGGVTVTGYKIQEKSAQIQEEVFFIVDEMPEFPGGQLALRNFIAQSVKYPLEAAKKGIQGKVFVNFVVGKDGSTTNAKIYRGVAPSLDMEALRVVNSLPKWKPGKQKGEEVAVSFTVPINFVLQ